jgi:hypothetical protein
MAVEACAGSSGPRPATGPPNGRPAWSPSFCRWNRYWWICSSPGAYDGGFVRRAQYKGWRRNIRPIAAFDAKSTEWEIAHIVDNDDEVAWWLRLDSQGPV